MIYLDIWIQKITFENELVSLTSTFGRKMVQRLEKKIEAYNQTE